MQFLTSLLDHPILLVFLLTFLMGFVGMTYEFILRLFGRKGMCEPNTPAPGDTTRNEPPEPANVPKQPTGPKDTLVAEAEMKGDEEVESEDAIQTSDYIYSDSSADDNWAAALWPGYDFNGNSDCEQPEIERAN